MNKLNARALVVGYEAGEAAMLDRVIKVLGSVAWVSIAKTDDGSRMVCTTDLIALLKEELGGV